MKAYECTRALGAILLILGGFALLSHLARQARVGSASAESLIGGAISLGVGIVLLILGDLGRRLIRIERMLTPRGDQSDDDHPDTLSQSGTLDKSGRGE